MTQLGAQPATPTPPLERDSTAPSVSTGQVASSALWRAIETAGTELVAFIVFTTLARLLAPDDFGAVALAGSIMTMLQGLVYHGFTEALIQRADVTDAHHRAVLAANLSLAAVLVAFGLLVAWPIGWVLGRSEFPIIFSALLPSLLFRSMSSPMLASLRRELDFRAIAIRTLMGVCVGGVMAVILAQRGVGFWALVVQQWSAELVGFAVLVRVSPCKPWSLRWNMAALRELIPVALPVAGAALLSVAARRMDTIVLALFLPNRAVGIYFFVYRLVFAAQMVTQHGMSEVAMVVLSSINREAERYRVALLRAMRLMSFVCACAFGLLATAGPWIVPFVFSDTWAPAAEPLRVMAALSVGGAVVSVAGVTLVASGYAAAYSRLVVGSALAQLLAVALTARYGLVTVAWGVGIAQCLSMIPALRMLSKYYELPVLRLVQQILPTLLLFGVGMALALWLGRMGDAWYVELRAVLAFCAVMGLGALLLLRKEREIARESMLPPAPPAAPN